MDYLVYWSYSLKCTVRKIYFRFFIYLEKDGYYVYISTRILILLKVDGNEKLGGLKFLQLLGIGLGPWRSISILILNMPFANKKCITVSGLSSNMNRR